MTQRAKAYARIESCGILMDAPLIETYEDFKVFLMEGGRVLFSHGKNDCGEIRTGWFWLNLGDE